MRLIDADTLKKHIEKARKAAKTLTGIDMVMLIEDAPTVDAVFVIHGWWQDHISCSHCGWMMIDDVICSPNCVAFPYCPNCGAKMDGEPE